jgi:GT2 family glycosyltransferase
MTVTVAIPSYRRAELLVRCLEGVLAQSPAPDEVIVVARPDDQETWRVIESMSDVAPALRGVAVHEAGIVPPVRAALAACSTDLMALIDDDATPCPGWLDALLNVMEDRSAAAAGGFVFTPGSRVKQRRNAGRITWYGQHIGNVGALRSSTTVVVDGVMEGNSIWRTDVMRSLEFPALFDEANSALYGLDLALQLKERGYSVVYTEKARVLHTPGPRPLGFGRHDLSQGRIYSRNYTYIALRRFRGLRRWTFALWWWLIGERGSYGLVTGSVDWLLGRTGWNEIRASFQGKSDGVHEWLKHQ